MKRTVCLLCAVLCLLLLGCVPQKGDYFAPFQGEFTARIRGEWQAIAFEAELAASAPNGEGERRMTLTFYAPGTLCGTVLTREESGALSLAHGELSLPLSATAAAGYGALFDLFPVFGEVRAVSRENGNTRLDGVGFSLLFSADGIPLAAENATARVQIEHFERQARRD